jgi:hypothetical protein
MSAKAKKAAAMAKRAAEQAAQQQYVPTPTPTPMPQQPTQPAKNDYAQQQQQQQQQAAPKTTVFAPRPSSTPKSQPAAATFSSTPSYMTQYSAGAEQIQQQIQYNTTKLQQGRHAGRPSHATASFGFGGNLVVMFPQSSTSMVSGNR